MRVLTVGIRKQIRKRGNVLIVPRLRLARFTRPVGRLGPNTDVERFVSLSSSFWFALPVFMSVCMSCTFCFMFSFSQDRTCRGTPRETHVAVSL